MGAPGFDNALLIAPGRVHEPRQLQLVYPYYENPEFLRKQLQDWLVYPQELRHHMRAIIVDDGSPRHTATTVLARLDTLPFPIRLFRIEVDVRWNWLAARNIAMHHATEGWCLLTDMDHVLTADAAQELVHADLCSDTIYRMSRREYTGHDMHPHPNTMLLTRAMFWKAGGYDEALSGHYGTDGDWRRRLAATAKVLTLSTEMVRYEFFLDSSTTHYKRKQPEDAGKKRIVAKRTKGWRPKVLSFPYHEVHL
jgi:glycosyltransferase involved in cell wall biosynthesis